MNRFSSPPKRLVEESKPFRVYPSRFHSYPIERRHYWLVRIFPDRQSMWDYVAWRQQEREEDFGAMCKPYYKIRIGRDGNRVSSKLGEIIFHDASFTPMVISHEALHAAAATCRVFFGEESAVALGDGCGDVEERLAYVLGSLVRQIASHSAA